MSVARAEAAAGRSGSRWARAARARKRAAHRLRLRARRRRWRSRVRRPCRVPDPVVKRSRSASPPSVSAMQERLVPFGRDAELRLAPSEAELFVFTTRTRRPDRRRRCRPQPDGAIADVLERWDPQAKRWRPESAATSARSGALRMSWRRLPQRARKCSVPFRAPPPSAPPSPPPTTPPKPPHSGRTSPGRKFVLRYRSRASPRSRSRSRGASLVARPKAGEPSRRPRGHPSRHGRAITTGRSRARLRCREEGRRG